MLSQHEPPSRLPEAEFVQFPYSIGATPPPQSGTLGESSTVAASADCLVTSPSTDSCSSESTAAEAEYVGGTPPLEQINSTVGLCSGEPWPRWGEESRWTHLKHFRRAPKILLCFAHSFLVHLATLLALTNHSCSLCNAVNRHNVQMGTVFY